MIYILFLALAVAFALNSWLLKNNREIIDIHTKLLKILQNSEKFQDKEIIQIFGKLEKFEKKLEFLEQKQTEMRANHCLLVRRVDNIFKDKIFLTNEDFLEALKIISKDLEKMSGEIEKIDTYQKRQNRRLKVLELNDNHICKGNWQFESGEKIF